MLELRWTPHLRVRTLLLLRLLLGMLLRVGLGKLATSGHSLVPYSRGPSLKAHSK